MNFTPALLIFIKNPLLGKVKSRLAATVGEKRALEIYMTLLEHTRQTALQCPAKCYLFYSDFIGKEDGWQEEDFIKKVQQGNDLGERMANAFSEILPAHDRALLVGSDIPQLSANILNEAFRQLTRHDFVIGPAVDGGYYLMGMKQPQPAVFQGITWSTSSVFSETVARIKNLGKTWFVLPKLLDIDTEEDWLLNG